MSMTVKILSAKYNGNSPEILGSLSFDKLGELTDQVLFVATNRIGQWKVHDFGRGGCPPGASDNKMLVSMVEVGECDALHEGETLRPTHGRAT